VTRIEPRLDVRDLQVVLAVAAAGTTARAAKALHLTQSAVSRALTLAEDKLGAQLFARTPRGLVPTEAGARLIGGAGPVLAQLAELETQVVAPAVRVELRLACECYTAYRWLPSVIAQLRDQLPAVEVAISLDRIAAPVDALLDGTLDVALLTTAAIQHPLEDAPLFSDEIVFVVAASHPLAQRPALTRRDLRDHPLITSTNAAPAESSWLLAEVFGRSVPQLSFIKLPLTEAILDVARAGMGIAVLSEWVASAQLGTDLVALRLATGPILRPWRIAYRPAFAEHARVLAQALEGSPPRLYAARRARP
jgi:LysR family transcriptional regulator for metE and metH